MTLHHPWSGPPSRWGFGDCSLGDCGSGDCGLPEIVVSRRFGGKLIGLVSRFQLGLEPLLIVEMSSDNDDDTYISVSDMEEDDNDDEWQEVSAEQYILDAKKLLEIDIPWFHLLC